MGQQSELLGAHALGIRVVLALTGDPASMGDEMGSSSVYDTNSLGLIELIAAMNRGVNRAGNPVQGATSFVIGGAFNPNASRLEPQVRRLEKKVAKGARFAMTQPVFDGAVLREMYEKTAHLGIPIFAGVMPLVSGRNAEFLHNEVPGIRIPDGVRRRMAEAGERGAEEGLAVAGELIDGARDAAPGFYIMPQLGKYEMALELVRRVKEKVRGE
jgi:homocysteine S-methyltransferase